MVAADVGGKIDALLPGPASAPGASRRSPASAAATGVPHQRRWRRVPRESLPASASAVLGGPRWRDGGGIGWVASGCSDVGVGRGLVAGVAIADVDPVFAGRAFGLEEGRNRVLDRARWLGSAACRRRPRRAGRPQSAAAWATGEGVGARDHPAAEMAVSLQSLAPGNVIAISRARAHSGAIHGRRAVERSDAEWRQRLSPEAIRGLPLFGDRTAVHRALNGTTTGRAIPLRRLRRAPVQSGDKFDSGTGWPATPARG